MPRRLLLPLVAVIALALGWRAFSGAAAADDANPFAVPFRNVIVDADPPSGADCCTDILAAGDVNGDGLLDLVLGTPQAPRDGLVWDASPQWTRHPVGRGEFTTDGQGVAAADIDRDGDLALVSAGPAYEQVQWFVPVCARTMIRARQEIV